MKKTPIIDVKPIGLNDEGSFISGTKWKKYDKVKINGKTFKKGQLVHWIDPDFGISVDDTYREYKFKIGGFMVYDNDIDILPKDEKGKNIRTGRWQSTALGRVPLDEVEEYEKNIYGEKA